MRLDHIGVAVRSLEAAMRPYQAALGLTPERVEEVPTEGVKVAFFAIGDTHLELLEPLSPESPISGFLEKRGEGIHHLAVEVPDVAEAISKARAAGVRLLSEEPRAGAGGSLVCFLHPKDMGGVLLELVQQPNQPEE